MTVVTRFFAGHPMRIGGAAIVLLIAAAVAWYLGSPLFIRTFKEEALPTANPPITLPSPGSQSPGATQTAVASPKVLAAGELQYVDSVHNGKGPVQVIDVSPGASRFVRFENVAITNAPDIHVYLSRETGGKWSESTSLYLGALKATNGSFNYDVPAGAELSGYRSVVVWCRAFSVLITWADLRPA